MLKLAQLRSLKGVSFSFDLVRDVFIYFYVNKRRCGIFFADSVRSLRNFVKV